MTSDEQLLPRLTAARLRQHAEAPVDPMWDRQAKQLLLWAADVLEAAELALEAERARSTRQ